MTPNNERKPVRLTPRTRPTRPREASDVALTGVRTGLALERLAVLALAALARPGRVWA